MVGPASSDQSLLLEMFGSIRVPRTARRVPVPEAELAMQALGSARMSPGSHPW